jgi:uncharacterized protein YlxW (UPF0749 family)
MIKYMSVINHQDWYNQIRGGWSPTYISYIYGVTLQEVLEGAKEYKTALLKTHINKDLQTENKALKKQITKLQNQIKKLKNN